jgi:hypothetical protein
MFQSEVARSGGGPSNAQGKSGVAGSFQGVQALGTAVTARTSAVRPLRGYLYRGCHTLRPGPWWVWVSDSKSQPRLESRFQSDTNRSPGRTAHLQRAVGAVGWNQLVQWVWVRLSGLSGCGGCSDIKSKSKVEGQKSKSRSG